MCSLAHRVEKVVEPSKNCNWDQHDMYTQSGQPSKRLDCRTRASYFREMGFSYAQVERELAEEEMCDDFSYGVMLRDPEKLMHSLVNYEVWFTKREGKTVHVPGDFKFELSERIDRGDVPESEAPLWVKLDNFQVRVLANAFDVPAGQIGDDHLARAKDRLTRRGFTVGILEDLPTNGADLFEAIGWPSDFASEMGKRFNGLKQEERRFSHSEKAFLRDLNQYDFQLYEDMRQQSQR